MQQKIKIRLLSLVQRPIRVHSEDAFDSPDAEKKIMSPEMPDYESYLKKREETRALIRTQPPELIHLYQEPLLTREQEYYLFKQFNYLKHTAKRILQEIDHVNPAADKVDLAEKLICKSNLIKRQLASSNVRLVMNLAKKQKDYASAPDVGLLSEIVSDGYIGLMQAVDYFDYRLGYKFCTYATWAILENMKRSRNTRIKHSVCSTGMEDSLFQIPDKGPELNLEYQERAIDALLQKIPEKQRQVIVEYYNRSRNLEEIGRDLGVCKERVRQIRNRGLKELKKLAK